MLRNLSLPVRLAALVTGTTLPLIAFAGTLVYLHYIQAQKEALDRVLQFTRSVELVLDREMQGILSGMTVLASSPSLITGDFEKTRSLADAFLSSYPGNAGIVIGDRSGQIVFNSNMAPGTVLPMRSPQPDSGAVFRTGRPTFSALFVGALSRSRIVTVTVPVFSGDRVLYDLSFSPPLQAFQRIIEQQKPSDEWTISIFDQKGVNFARVPNPENTIGKSASPTLLAVMFSAPEGGARTVSLEGVPLLTAFVRSNLTGWVAAAGIAEATLVAPALRTFAVTAAIGAFMLAIGLAFAVRMATRIAHVEALHTLLLDELNHRVKNTLATVQSLASQSFRAGTEADARAKFEARLASLGRSHDILSEKKWEGANIKDVVERALTPFQGGDVRRIQAEGASIQLPSRAVVMLSMALHELATNAGKYGALTIPGGRVLVDWKLTGDGADKCVELHWRETDGPEIKAPIRKGFGSRLIQDGFATQLGGATTLQFEPDGVACKLEFPLK